MPKSDGRLPRGPARRDRAGRGAVPGAQRRPRHVDRRHRRRSRGCRPARSTRTSRTRPSSRGTSSRASSSCGSTHWRPRGSGASSPRPATCSPSCCGPSPTTALPASLVIQFWGEAMVDGALHDEMMRTAGRLGSSLTTALTPWARESLGPAGVRRRGRRPGRRHGTHDRHARAGVRREHGRVRSARRAGVRLVGRGRARATDPDQASIAGRSRVGVTTCVDVDGVPLISRCSRSMR